MRTHQPHDTVGYCVEEDTKMILILEDAQFSLVLFGERNHPHEEKDQVHSYIVEALQNRRSPSQEYSQDFSFDCDRDRQDTHYWTHSVIHLHDCYFPDLSLTPPLWMEHLQPIVAFSLEMNHSLLQSKNLESVVGTQGGWNNSGEGLDR